MPTRAKHGKTRPARTIAHATNGAPSDDGDRSREHAATPVLYPKGEPITGSHR
jgi:hypothetical protein